MAFRNFEFCLDPFPVPKIKTQNREVTTGIPCPGTRKIFDEIKRYESRSMQGQIPLVWDGAKDATITDICGNRFIDFTSAIFLANTGHANAKVVDAVIGTLQRPLLHAYNYPTKIRSQYLKALVEFAGAGMDKAFLLSAGTEATEAALKLMRLHGLKQNKSRPIVISFKGNYHGRTMGAQMLSANEHQKQWIGFQDPNIRYLDFPYPWALNGQSGKDFFTRSLVTMLYTEQLDLSRDVCGVMMEVFQGWAAAFYPPDFVQEVRRVCDENEILLCFDEVQSGFARTGKAFGYEHYGVNADLLCCGKGMGSGVAVSAVIGKRAVMDLPEPGSMSSTHSANPIACAAGLATLQEIKDKNLIERAALSGALLFRELDRLCVDFPNIVSYVMGKGLMAALHFGGQRAHLFASRVSEQCYRKGLLVVFTGRESIKLGPPLIISDAALLEGVAVIREAINEVLVMDACA